MSETPANLTPHMNLWITCREQVVLSRWRVQLLEAVAQSGSISGAAERMGIQYRLAYDRLQEMEEGLGLHLIDRRVGGPGGGGASLTETGAELIERFNRFAERMDQLLNEAFGEQFAGSPTARRPL